MSYCDYCHKEINGRSFRCQRCGETFCSNHKFPKNHNCRGLKSFKKKQKNWKIISKNESKSPRKIREKNSLLKKFIKDYWFLLILVFIVGVIVLYSNGFHLKFIPHCEDGTWENRCSKDKPYFCFEGVLSQNSTSCGCSYGYEPNANNCSKIPTCSDGTFYNECSKTKPFYCSAGTPIENASICGCPSKEVREGNKCKSKYETNSKIVTLPEIGNFEVYGGLNDYLSGLPDSISYSSTPPKTKDFIMRDIDNEIQDKYLSSLVEKIKEKSSDPNEQARIAIRLVQKIPYDYSGLSGVPEGRLPYEVIYDMAGVCGEKSKLLGYLLREIGFGVATFEFESENHESVGIKCSSCDYQNSGYCFIESTSPTIPTDSQGEYLGAGKLGAPSEIIQISEGNSLDLSEECSDAQEWNNLLEKGEVLSSYDYNKWKNLVEKYGMQIGD